jgi:hypothetical protein
MTSDEMRIFHHCSISILGYNTRASQSKKSEKQLLFTILMDIDINPT